MTNQVSDFQSGSWWNNMYNRYSLRDPSNHQYGTFNNAGLNLPITIESTNQYAVQLKRYADGVAAYKVGIVSPSAADLQASANIQRCTDATGHPVACAMVGLASPSSKNTLLMRALERE
jgi:hypothetical protein